MIDLSSLSADILWQDGDESLVREISSPNDYQITVTDMNGCTFLDSIYITVDEKMTTLMEVVLCEGDSHIVDGIMYDTDTIIVDTIFAED